MSQTVNAIPANAPAAAGGRKNPIVKAEDYSDEKMFFVPRKVETIDKKENRPVTTFQLWYNYVNVDKIDEKIITDATKPEATPSFKLFVPEFNAFPCRVGFEKKDKRPRPPVCTKKTTDEDVKKWWNQMAIVVRWDRQNPEHVKYLAMSSKLHMRTVRELIDKKGWMDHGKVGPVIRMTCPQLVKLEMTEDAMGNAQVDETKPATSLLTFWVNKNRKTGEEIRTKVKMINAKGELEELKLRDAYRLVTTFKFKASAILNVQRLSFAAGNFRLLDSLDTLIIKSIDVMEQVDWSKRFVQENEHLRATEEEDTRNHQLMADLMNRYEQEEDGEDDGQSGGAGGNDDLDGGEDGGHDGGDNDEDDTYHDSLEQSSSTSSSSNQQSQQIHAPATTPSSAGKRSQPSADDASDAAATSGATDSSSADAPANKRTKKTLKVANPNALNSVL
jgi:hypothetical protein